MSSETIIFGWAHWHMFLLEKTSKPTVTQTEWHEVENADKGRLLGVLLKALMFPKNQMSLVPGTKFMFNGSLRIWNPTNQNPELTTLLLSHPHSKPTPSHTPNPTTHIPLLLFRDKGSEDDCTLEDICSWWHWPAESLGNGYN